MKIACTLTAEDLGAQAARWRKLRAEAGIARIATGSGVRLSFRDDVGVEEELRALADVENDCCSWALWEVARADGTLVLDVSSSGHGIAVLHGMF